MPTLNWIGKDKVVTHHQEVPFHVLEHKYGFTAEDGQIESSTESGNMIIHGDNLVALKSLLPKYEGRVDCIYIDPPYNTGNEGWVYNDNVNDPHIKKWLGEVVGKQGEDLSRHDKWLCMMYPRLKMLQKLLSPAGAIFVSIDDNEVSNLRLMMDNIFGQNCFVADVKWQRTYSQRNDADGIGVETEHVLVYGKQKNWQPKNLERTEEMDAKYANPDGDPLGNWQNTSAHAPGAVSHQGMVYAIQHPFTGELVYPANGRCWTFGQMDVLNIMNGWCEYELRELDDAKRRAEVCGIPVEEIREGVLAIMLKEDLPTSRAKAQVVYAGGQWPRFFFTKGGLGGIRRKTYLSKVEGRKVTNLWLHNDVGHTDSAKKELKAIFEGKIPFDTPKPSTLIERILQIATDDYSVVLDSFAGSATTAHAVLKMNKDNPASQRKFVLIELMDYAETITAERVRRVAQGYSFKGKKEEEIYCKKLTSKNILKAKELLKEAFDAIEVHKDKYEKIGKPKIDDNCLKVIGTKIYDGQMPGLGGAFDYYELGLPLFDENGFLNEEVETKKIREYIFYSETRLPLVENEQYKATYLLGEYNRTDYYFYYEPKLETTFGPDSLDIIVRKADSYIVYADICLFSKEELTKMNIIFKKIPRDIHRF
ncbi:site-specific DNA-methyltransferase [Parabacteroides distasonis]|uniref:site-specific DNA-methyltransferase (adenine-specific) n=2 Tax=Parabacteroides distasonis TaxID=823 RepID=A0A4S2ELV7_PARDI|nr:site-specific DNA-methyltransferase [Parabacteroides distasonis]TGY55294.1 site-specific DNA-methyltransferase [Parabacteroides distasonis]